MSATLIPGTDSQIAQELEENPEKLSLKELAENRLNGVEPQEEGYDIGYEKHGDRTKRRPGTSFRMTTIAPHYDGPEIDIDVPVETDVEEFYANLEAGEFRIETEDGEKRTYILSLSNEDGIIVNGETGYGDNKEFTKFIYEKNEELNELKFYRDGWRQYGKALHGEGNQTMRHIELIEDVYHQLMNAPQEDNSWNIVYSENLEKNLEDLPPHVESSLDSKTSDFEGNLALNTKPEEMFSAMSPPWKPLLEMRLADYRGIFIASSNLPENSLPQEISGDRNLLGISLIPKKEFNSKFKSKGGSGRETRENGTSGMAYALNRLN